MYIDNSMFKFCSTVPHSPKATEYQSIGESKWSAGSVDMEPGQGRNPLMQFVRARFDAGSRYVKKNIVSNIPCPFTANEGICSDRPA